ncbi:MAG: 16S rRNA (uracil(1498)-N(3))-methyltransferase [Reyranellaceae bacterium]
MAGDRDEDLQGEGGRQARLFVDAALTEGGIVELDADRAHYLRNVLRLEPGATVKLFNGRDGEWRAAVEAAGKRHARLIVGKPVRAQEPEPDLWLVFAPIKRARIDFVAEKATELGVSALLPVFTRYTAMTRVNVDRLRANALEAAEQTERLSVPRVHEAVTFEALLRDWPQGRRLLLADESGGGAPVGQALRELDASASAAPWAVLVGPEGGFHRDELDALHKLDFVTAVGLGPRILRADTAALAALACWQALVGDWERPTPRLPLDYGRRDAKQGS